MIKIKTVVLISVGVGLVIATYGIYIGFTHNTQGEFISINDGQVDWIYSIQMFAIWFAASMFSCFLLIGIPNFLIGLIKKKSKKVK